jgi:serine protease Do
MKRKPANSLLRGNTLVSVLAAVESAVIALVLTSWLWSWPVPLHADDRAVVSVNVSNTPVARETRLTTSYSPVVKRVAPSVVYVYSTKTVRNPFGRELRPLFDDPFFRRFFGDRFDEDQDSPRKMPRAEKQHSLGSGVIVSKDGHILTNNHVVDGADEIKVSLFDDKRDFTAKVVGRDAKTDIAVLKIDAGDLPPITFADSGKVEVGDVVLAVGNPFGIGQTVTMGIVSATRRGGMGIEEYEDFIQTDAAINPGNSGGALVDTEGRLVGICTAILSRSGGNQGVGFAVPVDLARSVMEQLLKKGRVERGYLGVSIQDVTPELRKDFDVPEGRGALVGGVTDGSAAADAGIKTGDVIVEFDGKAVKDSSGLKLMVGQAAPGAKVEVKVRRDGKEKTFTVALKEMPDKVAASGSGESTDAPGEALRGVTVTDIDAEARGQFDLPATLKGALITKIDADSAAYGAGLRKGDVIQEINRQPIASAEDAERATKNLAGKRLMLRVWSRGGSRFVVVDESKER